MKLTDSQSDALATAAADPNGRVSAGKSGFRFKPQTLRSLAKKGLLSGPLMLDHSELSFIQKVEYRYTITEAGKALAQS